MSLRSRQEARGPSAEPGLTICISRGTGTGRTPLSAFDAALGDAGVADFNLVRLSSVIPPGSRVVQVAGRHPLECEHGDVLYCVYAAGYATRAAETAWAGISWALRNDGSAAGLFVEHTSSDRAHLVAQLRASIEDLSTHRGGCYDVAGTVLASATCTSTPVCAIVIASYRCAGW